MDEKDDVIRCVLGPAEREALDLAAVYLRARSMPGQRVTESDVIRFCLHSAGNLCAAEMATCTPEGDVNVDQE